MTQIQYQRRKPIKDKPREPSFDNELALRFLVGDFMLFSVRNLRRKHVKTGVTNLGLSEQNDRA
jgi:hypothetical protein